MVTSHFAPGAAPDLRLSLLRRLCPGLRRRRRLTRLLRLRPRGLRAWLAACGRACLAACSAALLAAPGGQLLQARALLLSLRVYTRALGSPPAQDAYALRAYLKF